MRRCTKPWYKVTFTSYTHYPAVPEAGIKAHTTWEIAERYFESIRKANAFLKEHAGDGRMSIIYR